MDNPFDEDILNSLLSNNNDLTNCEVNDPNFDFYGELGSIEKNTQWIPHKTSQKFMNPSPNHEDSLPFSVFKNNNQNENNNILVGDKNENSYNDPNDDFVNMMDFENDDDRNIIPIPISVLPPEPEPTSFDCTWCQVLRVITHVNGTITLKFEIHGSIGVISHAILETRNMVVGGPPSLTHQMIDFSGRSMENVKQYLNQYCQDRKNEGFVMVQDPLTNFYDALCAGSNCRQNVIRDEFSQPPNTPPVSGDIGRREENNGTRVHKTNLSEQRERTTKLSLTELANYFHLPIDTASKQLRLCSTVVKKICRKNGMRRWPYRKVTSIIKKINEFERRLSEEDEETSAYTHAEIENLKQELGQLYSVNKERQNDDSRIQGTEQLSRIQGTEQHSGIQGTEQHSGIQGTEQHSGIQGTEQHSGIQGTVTGILVNNPLLEK